MLKRIGIFTGIWGASAILGFSVWALSPYLTGYAEPWDSSLPFYSLILSLGGAAIGLLSKGRFVILGATACGVGVWGGQVIAISTLPGLDRSWFQLGLVTTLIGSSLPVVGFVIAGAIILSCRKMTDIEG